MLLLTLCTGCFYSRLLSFKNQLKSFDENVVLSADGRQEHTYLYRSLTPTAGAPLTLCFQFEYQPKGLAAFDYPVSMARVLGTNLIVSAAKAVGKSRLIQREYKLDWASQCTNLTAELVPSLADVREVFGPEQSRGSAPLGAVLNYAFRLEPSKTDPRPTNAMLNATFQFDAANDLLRHGEISMGKLKMVVELPPVR